MDAPTLRPLRIGEILDVAIKLYLRNAGTLLRVVLLVVVPVQVLSVLINASTVLGSSNDPEGSELAALIAGQVIVGILGLITFLLTTAGCFKAVSDAYLGASPAWRDSLRFAVRRAPSLLWLSLVLFVLLFIGLVFLLIPAIWLGIAWSVAIPALLFEDVRGFGALRRSFRLVRRRWWPTFGALIVGVLLSGIVGGIVQSLLSFAPAAAGGPPVVVLITTAIGGAISSAITTPFQAAVVTLLYFDLRVRKEGFDLALLAERMGSAPGSADTPGTPLAPGAGYVPQEQYTAEERASAPYWPPPPGWRPPGREPAPGEE